MAEVLIQAGKTDQAIALVEAGAGHQPGQRALAMLHAEALIAKGRHREAEAVLERQSIVHQDDVDVWYNLAEVSGLAGNIIGVHLARAQFFYLHAAYQRALQHLEYARPPHQPQGRGRRRPAQPTHRRLANQTARAAQLTKP